MTPNALSNQSVSRKFFGKKKKTKVEVLGRFRDEDSIKSRLTMSQNFMDVGPDLTHNAHGHSHGIDCKGLCPLCIQEDNKDTGFIRY